MRHGHKAPDLDVWRQRRVRVEVPHDPRRQQREVHYAGQVLARALDAIRGVVDPLAVLLEDVLVLAGVVVVVRVHARHSPPLALELLQQRQCLHGLRVCGVAAAMAAGGCGEAVRLQLREALVVCAALHKVLQRLIAVGFLLTLEVAAVVRATFGEAEHGLQASEVCAAPKHGEAAVPRHADGRLRERSGKRRKNQRAQGHGWEEGKGLGPLSDAGTVRTRS
mmetsp:Transcript_79096/g.218888  ORF Transcript_79096/g.218888 Transcript_79096/m.218888 type:complete len:222 (+) Transcript_79096:417-1082(+)